MATDCFSMPEVVLQMPWSVCYWVACMCTLGIATDCFLQLQKWSVLNQETSHKNTYIRCMSVKVYSDATWLDMMIIVPPKPQSFKSKQCNVHGTNVFSISFFSTGNFINFSLNFIFVRFYKLLLLLLVCWLKFSARLNWCIYLLMFHWKVMK